VVYVAKPVQDFGSYRRNIEDSFLRVLDDCGDLGARARSARRAERIRTTIDLPHRMLRSSGGGWALVGDAGFVMDPISAQGISQAFLGAEYLTETIGSAWKSQESLDAGLAAYERVRNARAEPIFDFTTGLAALTRAAGGACG